MTALAKSLSFALDAMASSRHSCTLFVPAPCRSGGTGRRAGLKIQWGVTLVWVRFPSPAPLKIKHLPRFLKSQYHRKNRSSDQKSDQTISFRPFFAVPSQVTCPSLRACWQWWVVADQLSAIFSGAAMVCRAGSGGTYRTRLITPRHYEGRTTSELCHADHNQNLDKMKHSKALQP